MTTATRRWWGREDHYNWLTAQLSLRGLQPVTCRLLAVATLAFGVLPAVMALSPAGPQGSVRGGLAIAVAVICAVLSIGWWRGGWPSKAWSVGYVVALSLCCSVVCLIQSEPLVGMLSCVAFGALAGYAAMFHAARVVMLTAAVALVTTVVLAVRVAAEGDVVLGVCSALLVGMVNIIVPTVFHATIHPLAGGAPNEDIDPLTGLYNKAAFDRTVGELISVRGRTDDRYFVLVVVVLDNFSLLTGTKGAKAGDHASVAVSQTLLETTRADAILAHGAPAQYLIADTFVTADVTPLVERVRSAIATTPPRLTSSIGAVVTPLRALADLPPQDVVDKLVDIAQTAVGEARRAGGNQARYIECNALMLEDLNSEADEPW